jgi:hypothetical protein
MKGLKKIVQFGSWLIIGISALPAFGQNYGNEWINYNQSYFRVPIPHTGMYRITNSELENAGIDVGNFNPQNIQLFYNGSEIPCYIKGESEGLIDTIEFFAEKNDGWFDKAMYADTSYQTNPYYSLINDTASVFFTWNTSFSNKRFTPSALTNTTNLSPAAYCIADTLVQYTNFYLVPKEIDCEYTQTEGWFDAGEIQLGGSLTKTIATPMVYNNNAKVKVEFTLVTYSTQGHHLNINGAGITLDTSFVGLKHVKYTAYSNTSDLSDNNTFTFKSIDDIDATTDFSKVSYIRIEYPMQYDFTGLSQKSFIIPASPAKNTYLEISGLDISGEVVLYDLTRNLRITPKIENGAVKAVVPSSSYSLNMFICTKRALYTADYLKKSVMTNHFKKNVARIIISNKKLWDQAQVYADYRGAYLVDIDDIYDQFGYGIVKHPMAIRNFLNYIYNTWTTKPQSLFIIGKGISAKNTRNNPSYYSQCLVPPMGDPATDILLSVGIANTGWVSAIPTGRLAAMSAIDVSLYYNKVLEFESNTQQEWMKNIIHFGGGNTAQEQLSFKNYLKDYENIIEDTLFGGYVSTFLKTSSDPITTSKTDSVAQLVNKGLSLITFFGHGYASGFDQNIDDPSAYKNQGKYPLMLANSCYSGDIFLPGKLCTSEEWVLIANRGAIGFLAMVYEGNAAYLNVLSERFYQNLAYKNYGSSLGVLINQAKLQMQEELKYQETKRTVQELNLHGDPNIVLNCAALPDLEVASSDISFTPKVLTTENDSFEVNIALRDIGKTISSPFQVELRRTFSDGTTSDYSQVMDKLSYKDTIIFKLPVEKVKGIGINQFSLTVDALKQINELSETNNSSSTSTFITSTSLSAVVPYKYSLVATAPAVLKASTADALSGTQTSIFQIDTTELFNSPNLISEELTHTGGVVDWTLPTSINEGKTYFWRVAEKSGSKSTKVWSQSSFVYRQGQSGWEQNHFNQIDDNAFRFIDKDANLHRFNFTKIPKTVRCHNIGSPNNSTYTSIGYSVDGVGDYSSCGASSALLLVVIDTATMIPWESNHGSYGQINYPTCRSNRNDNYFIFYMNEYLNTNITSLINMVDNVVPDGFYILIYSFNGGNYRKWPLQASPAFESWGATQVSSIMDNAIPYIFFTRKGYPDESIEVIGESAVDVIDLHAEIKTNFNYGSIISPIIGPAKSWISFVWGSAKIEDNPTEIAFVNIAGITSSGNEVELMDSITDSPVDLSGINATTYPNLRLTFYTRDETYKTPSQLTDWRVLFESYTDLAINPQKGWEFYADSLQEGDKGKVSMAFDNIGYSTSDSVLVKYWLQNGSNQLKTLSYHKLSPVAPGQNVTDTISFKSLGLSGVNYFWAELNPVTPGGLYYDQNEQTHFNNLAHKSFYVNPDQNNPLLDVTFDGLHIMDGDLVSAKPEIMITLTDENAYLALDDTSLISMFITSSQTGVETKITLSNNPQISFNPGELNNNKASIVYNADFEVDGTYQLRVRANDASGNESGNDDYVISFEVINESTITNVFNYPNPFSTSTRFVFELTGSELPDEFRIDIMTVTGKIVKVIYLDELGPLQIGKNITTYAWDGRDTYGDPLANGVYFYKITSRINGQGIKSRDSGTDKFFEHGIGKMYILR